MANEQTNSTIDGSGENLMHRREFLAAAGSMAILPHVALGQSAPAPPEHPASHHVHKFACPTYASPADAMRSEREKLAYVPAIYVGTGRPLPDHLVTVDVDPGSKTYGRIVHRLVMPNRGDELHHYGWNVCSSCHGQPGKVRQYLVIPGLNSGNVHFVDVSNPAKPRLHKAIEGREIAQKTNLSALHTVHCAPDGRIIISALGDANGNAPGGFLIVDEKFNVAGRWEKSTEGMPYNYDFWYQPRQNAMVSSEFAAPTTFGPGFRMEDVKAGLYGQRLHFWDWTTRERIQTIDLGAEGMVPLEVRFHHNPDSMHGFVCAALSSSVWHFHKTGLKWSAEKVIQVEPVKVEGQADPVPGLITDILLSLDDRFLYLANWLHEDIRQYNISNPAQPKLTGQVWIYGLLGKGGEIKGRKPTGGPQMLQLSLDGKRLYFTSSLYSSWDNQFYPGIAKKGSLMLQLDCDTADGGLEWNKDFMVDFGSEPGGPARAHEIRFPGGDCTSDIWV
ncbi:MAG TPA: selenium-binding family protein [Sedimentisphaerales bacterium]|nr:selenium-binding family protein [Sedimentisphaerales bacterium]